MIKSVGTLILATGFLLSPAISYAGCWMQCIAKNPISGSCVAKTKICNPGDDPGLATKTMYDDFIEDSVAIWHKVYGYVPEWARDVLNQHSAEAIGLYFGGLEGAALAEAMEQIYKSIEVGAKASKKAEESGLPDYIQEEITNVSVIAGLVKAQIGIDYEEGSANYVSACAYIDRLQIDANNSLFAARNKEKAKEIVKEFRRAAYNY